jgi:hypothetical protein
MEEKAKIISAIIVGVGGYFGIKYLTKGKGGTEQEQATFMGGGAVPNTDAYVETVPNTVYNVNVESPSVPADFGEPTTFAEAPTKKEVAVSSSSSGSGYYSTNFQTQSTNKAVDFSKTSATSKDRFATNPTTGATIDRYEQQSISSDIATERANATKKVFSPAPLQSFLPNSGLKAPVSKAPATTKKEEKSKPAPKKKTWWKPSTWGK